VTLIFPFGDWSEPAGGGHGTILGRDRGG
jgi:hypothetical protein